jgi:hypothetical protein
VEAILKLWEAQSQATERRFQQLEQLVLQATSVRPNATANATAMPLASKSDCRGLLQEDPLQEAADLESFKLTAMAGWPEMPLEDVGHADKFRSWRKLYSEYVSKCTDKQRTPATMAQSFSKWATWFATAFTEQERQRQEQTVEYGGGALSPLRVLRAVDVLLLPDDEFVKRYLAFCQVKIKDPSQVLQLLATPKVDVSTGDLVQLMQAAQSFTEQLQLIPKAALQQCEPSQIREAFIASIFGAEQLRERKVDYLKCSTWHEACQLMIRKASGAGGVAFTPFKPLKELQLRSNSSEKHKDKSEANKDKHRNNDQDDSKPNMTLKTEMKWKTRFFELADEHGIQKPRHAFAASWKTRYAYLLDCIKQDSKCNRCRRRGHLPSACPDPLPEVPYPDLTEEQVRHLGSLTLTQYDEEGNVVQTTSRTRHGQPKQLDEKAAQRTPRSPYQGRREIDHRQERSSSSERQAFGQQQDARQQDISQDRGPPQHGGRPSTPTSQECYRCGREGHRSSDCKSDTHRDGRPLQPRSERSHSPNYSNNPAKSR